MVRKKVTIKDIAKEANVSTATVSYILNKVPKQTISEETRCRVLEAAERLNYVPNLAARSLVKQQSGLIGILINRTSVEPWWRRLRYAAMVNRLEQLLTEQGYHVVLSSLDAANPNMGIIAERKLDGVFLVDVKQDQFYRISNHFPEGVPLVVIDSLIEDTLFYKVISDYEDAIRRAVAEHAEDECYFITEPYYNEPFEKSIVDFIGVPEDRIHRMRDEESLAAYISQQVEAGRKGVVLNEFISTLAVKYTDPTALTIICSSGCPELTPAGTNLIMCGESKPEAAFNVMMQLLGREEGMESSKYVIVK